MKILLKPTVFIVCLLPFIGLIYDAVTQSLGANPVEAITHETGEWALRFLLITLCATPLQRWRKWSWPVRIRRMLGLYAFFYAALHFTTYFWLDQFFDWQAMLIDIVKRPYILVGFLAFILLIPLAATSNRFMIRKLGRQWKSLHALVYPIAVLVLLHYVWLVKADLLEPAIYLGVLLVLLSVRLIGMLTASKTTAQA
ncbi:MAG: protein-methionine-sulfoxide reductase heme-binding subunit MsrQ [Pseudomonadota bacterium]